MIDFTLPCSDMLAFWSPGPWEMMLLALVALLLYGGNLPEVARSWGKTLSDFRRDLSGIKTELNEVMYEVPERLEYYEENYESGETESADSDESSEEKTQDESSTQPSDSSAVSTATDKDTPAV